MILGIIFLMAGCQRFSNVVWEDTKTKGRYLQRKGQLLWGKDVDSRMLESTDDFIGPQEDEYIALQDEDLRAQCIDRVDSSIPQPKMIPGGVDSPVPGIDAFTKPQALLASLFKMLYFNTDEYVLRSQEYYQVVDNIAEHMKTHTNLYIFIAGHCDERGSEAYNLALGTRRANTVRNLLVKRGSNPNHIYTISFGKEMPQDLRHSAEAWAKNRRVEFKIYEKKDFR